MIAATIFFTSFSPVWTLDREKRGRKRGSSSAKALETHHHHHACMERAPVHFIHHFEKKVGERKERERELFGKPVGVGAVEWRALGWGVREVNSQSFESQHSKEKRQRCCCSLLSHGTACIAIESSATTTTRTQSFASPTFVLALALLLLSTHWLEIHQNLANWSSKVHRNKLFLNHSGFFWPTK